MWRDWIALCLRLLEDGIHAANYGKPSPIQTRLCGPTDEQKLQQHTRSLARNANIPVADFRKKLGLSKNKVERYCARDEHHRIFKGKWFAAILADDINRIMRGVPFDASGLAARLLCSVSATLDFSEPWADYFRIRLDVIARMLEEK